MAWVPSLGQCACQEPCICCSILVTIQLHRYLLSSTIKQDTWMITQYKMVPTLWE